MQWDDSPNAGFCAAGVDPWLPVTHDYRDRNVARQCGDPESVLSFYRALIRLRRTEPALHVGEYQTVEVGDSATDVFAFLRTRADADRFLVVLNLSANKHVLALGQIGERAEIAVATEMKHRGSVDLSSLLLHPDEGLVLRLL